LKRNGKPSDFDEEDEKRRNLVVHLLQEWGLCKVKGEIGPKAKMSSIKILPYSEKNSWTLKSKYTIGKK